MVLAPFFEKIIRAGLKSLIEIKTSNLILLRNLNLMSLGRFLRKKIADLSRKSKKLAECL